MKLTRRQNLSLMGSTLVAAAAPGALLAAEHEEPKTIEVQMLNQHPETNEPMVFYPALIEANPGDTIRFVSTDRGHNSAANEDMLPEGVEPWKSQIGQDFELTVDVEGTYGFNCTPHYTVGMVGLILVGDFTKNFEEAQEARHRGRARQRFDELFAQAEEILANRNA